MFAKYYLLLLPFLMCFSAGAQVGAGGTIYGNSGDTAIFYYKFPDIRLTIESKPDYIRMIYPPDTTVDKKLFVVKDFYPDGKLKMVGNSRSNITPFLVGPYIEFFQNGKRKSTGNYANEDLFRDQHLTGVSTDYYVNGKVLAIKDNLDGSKHKLIECRDTSGNLLTDKGKGKWLEYNWDFKSINREGQVVNGLEEGEWHESRADTISYVTSYKKGKLISGVATVKSGKQYTFTEFDATPHLRKGNTETFFKNNFRFGDLPESKFGPIRARVTFTVDEMGKVADVKAIGNGNTLADDEAVRVIKSSINEWTPAFRNGLPKFSECEADFSVSSSHIAAKEGQSEGTQYYMAFVLHTIMRN